MKIESHYLDHFVYILVQRFYYQGEQLFNIDDELKGLTHPVTNAQLDPESRDAIEKGFLDKIRYRKSREGSVIVPVSMVSDPRGHEEWYEEWLSSNDNDEGMYYWKRLEDFLSQEFTPKYGPERAGKIIKSIDEATHSIMGKMANPLRTEFNYKGLVLGHVQSGKTANFTALIAKAADSGYKLIIVLAGIHNILRRQTQIRLDRELTGITDVTDPRSYISIPGPAKRWNRFTSAGHDFSIGTNGLFENYCSIDNPSLFVVKKNVSVLDKLIEYFNHASTELRAQLPVLVIDDEADQASVDTNANDPDSDPTRTNRCIRSILKLFPCKTYVGYTATPFANVLIDMQSEHDAFEDDLYPRNFIVSLPQPEGYFGTAELFKSDLSEKFVEAISPEEGDILVSNGKMSVHLSEAIDEFILGCAVRNLRQDRMKPMSMLVHVSRRIDDMKIIKKLIDEYVSEIAGRYYNQALSAPLKDEFRYIWDRFHEDGLAIREQLDLEHFTPDYHQVWDEVGNIFDILRVMELSSDSGDSLDYETGEEIKVIAVGGDKLSRGLTLEGLMTSYYLRESRQYDTLLQMGRWFGYRKGYEDLTRIHTTEGIWSFFEHLALVEDELRSEIYRYEEENMTPLQMAVAIRDHRYLNVTAPNKMGAARARQISYSDSLNQTIWFPLDKPEILRANYHLGDSFIRDINTENGFENINGRGVYLAKQKVPGEWLLESFLNRYTFANREETAGPGLDANRLLKYIFRRLNDTNPELTKWSVAVVGNQKSTKDNPSVKYGDLSLNMIQRSRKHTEHGYNIGVLTEPAHLKINGVSRELRSPQNPLLLLYLVWKGSKAVKFVETDRLRPNVRIDLYRFIDTQKVDLLGIAVVLPKSDYEPENYIGQLL